MNEYLVITAWLVATYLVGGIPFGFIIGKSRGVDVRTAGSKNIGSTNVFRTVGKKWGLLTLGCDILKGLLPVLAVKYWGGSEVLSLAVGVTAVVGHMLTPYMGFKGGKGVATALGMLIGLMPLLVGVAFLIFAVTFALSNYISLGSCVSAAFLAVGVWFPWLGVTGAKNLPQCVLVTLIAIFIIFKHRANLKRLAQGCENKIYLFKQPVKEDTTK